MTSSSQTKALGNQTVLDERTFGSLYAETFDTLFRYACALTGDQSLAEDVVADAYLRAWEQRRTFRQRGTVTSWLLSITHNTAISALIEFNNELVSLQVLPAPLARDFLRLLVPLAPHLAEELWQRCEFGSGDLSFQDFPVADEQLLVEDTVTLPIQVNGKVRGNVEVPVDLSEDELRERVMALDNIRRHIPDPESGIKRFIVVPGRIVNIVV